MFNKNLKNIRLQQRLSQKQELDLSLLGRLFEISYEYIYHQREVDEEFNAFFLKNTSALELLKDFETVLKQQQIIKIKTVQGIHAAALSILV